MSSIKPGKQVLTAKQPRLPTAVKIISLVLKHLTRGQLNLELPDGRMLTFGTPVDDDGPAVLTVHD